MYFEKNQVANHNVDGAEEIKQITAICAFAGLMDMQKASDILEKDGAKGLSSFMGYYVTQVIAKSGRMDKAHDIIRQFWGGMLDMGATSFWEDFDIEWLKNAAPITDVVPEGKDDIHGDFGKYCYTQFRHSLCHGWAGNPTAFMSQYVLGIFPVEAGFKKVAVKPSLGNLKYAKGKFPTPYGEICVEHKVVDGKVVTNVTAPDEIEIIK